MVEKNTSNGTVENANQVGAENQMTLTLQVGEKIQTLNGQGLLAAINMGENNEKGPTAVLVGGVIDSRMTINLFMKLIEIIGLDNFNKALEVAVAMKDAGVDMGEAYEDQQA